MKIVVDTSVIIAVITNEILKKKLVQLTKGAELVAPSSLHWEVGNAFSAMFKRGRIRLEKAKLAVKEYQKIPIQFLDVDLNFVLEISERYDMYAYDAYFLVCAMRLNLPLLTFDKQLISKAEKIGVETIEV